MSTQKSNKDQEKRLFIGGIDATVTEDMLEKHFSQFGNIEKAEVIRDKTNNISKGYGFIRVNDINTIEKILAEEHKINNRKVDVNFAAQKWETKNLKRQLYSRRIFINGVKRNISSDELRNYFSRFGQVKNAYLIIDPKTGKTKTFGYVEFYDKDGAEKALKKKKHHVKSSKIRCSKYQKKGESPEESKNSAGTNSGSNSRDGSPLGNKNVLYGLNRNLGDFPDYMNCYFPVQNNAGPFMGYSQVETQNYLPHQIYRQNIGMNNRINQQIDERYGGASWAGPCPGYGSKMMNYDFNFRPTHDHRRFWPRAQQGLHNGSGLTYYSHERNCLEPNYELNRGTHHYGQGGETLGGYGPRGFDVQRKIGY